MTENRVITDYVAFISQCNKNQQNPIIKVKQQFKRRGKDQKQYHKKKMERSKTKGFDEAQIHHRIWLLSVIIHIITALHKWVTYQPLQLILQKQLFV